MSEQDELGESQIRFTLTSNAMDSLQRTIELLAWKDVTDENSRLKLAIVLTAHAVELLLKERLRRVHPSLIWENVDKYPSLEARTVTVDQAIKRLRNIGGLVLSEANVKLVTTLRNTRNAIEHFGWHTTRNEANFIVGRGLSFAVEFAQTQLETNLDYEFKDDDTWRQLLSEHREFAKATEERQADSRSSSHAGKQWCMFCRAVTVDSEVRICSICGHWNLVDSTAESVPF